jgi:hypothetical protein
VIPNSPKVNYSPVVPENPDVGKGDYGSTILIGDLFTQIKPKYDTIPQVY